VNHFLKIYGLAGASGTGKSYHAQSLMIEMNITCIIDDGLLIQGTKVLAGISAKKESTRIASIRRALFMDQSHADAVKESIRRIDPDSILIIGTSVSMIERIAERLELPSQIEFIRIEDIATEQEIRYARRQRREQGKHIIPVPTFEISKDFSGFFLDSLKIFKTKGRSRKPVALEKTVVRPTFSYFGKFFIADSAIESIITFCAANTEGVQKALGCSITSQAEGIDIVIDVAVYYGYRIDAVLEQVQHRVREDVSYITGLNVLHIQVTAKKLVLKESDEIRPWA